VSQYSGSFTIDSSGNGTATVIPQGPYEWLVSGISFKSPTPGLTGTIQILLDGNLLGISYYPSSDVGTESSPFPVSSSSTLSLVASGIQASSVINYTVYYTKRLGP
jgi:hypothetical protein